MNKKIALRLSKGIRAPQKYCHVGILPAVLNPPAESRNILFKNLKIIAWGRGGLVVQKYVIRPILYKSKKVM